MSASRERPYDPCFSCPLPDCDEDSPKCGLKRANAAYSQVKKAGRLSEAPQSVRDGHNAWYHAYKLERDARRSEAAAALFQTSEALS